MGGEGGDVEAEGTVESTEHDSGGVLFRGELESIEEMGATGGAVEDDGVEEQGAESIEEICAEEQGEVEFEESMLESTSHRCCRAHGQERSLRAGAAEHTKSSSSWCREIAVEPKKQELAQRCYRAHDLHQSLFGESSWPGSRLPGSGSRPPGMALRSLDSPARDASNESPRIHGGSEAEIRSHRRRGLW